MKLSANLLSVLVLCACTHVQSTDTGMTKAAENEMDRYSQLRALDKRVKIEEIPATNVISLHFTGNYQKHPEAYGQLAAYVAENYRTTGGVIGTYPQDPDLVEESRLTWDISLRILPSKEGEEKKGPDSLDAPFELKATSEELSVPLNTFKKPSLPFELQQLPPISAVTLISDVAHIGTDGLLINAWTTMNNYVQVGTTRTEFGSATQASQAIPVKIIVPIKKRIMETIH